MTPLEKDIESKLIKLVKRHGGKCPKWVSPGWAGVPDRLCLLPGGQIIFVETKRPKGSRVAALQKKWREWLQELGFAVLHVYTEADLKDLERFITYYFQWRGKIIIAAGRCNGKTEILQRVVSGMVFRQVWEQFVAGCNDEEVHPDGG